MSKKAAAPAEAAPEIDEHHGKGGSYVIGDDGKRTLVHRTQPAQENPVKEQDNGTAEA